MRIGIDARKIADFGIGTYIRGLLAGLSGEAGEEDYVVFAPASARELIPRGFEHMVVEAPHYSVRELFLVGRAARRADLDLLHAPHYVVPFTRVPVVVTIHDLIHLHQPHRNPLAKVYATAMIGRAVRSSARVLTVSEAVRGEIVQRFGCPESKVVVTPNGVDERFRAAEPNGSPSPYFLYVGNDKPHKNVDRLVAAYARVRERRPDLSLVLVGGAFERHRATAGVETRGFVANGDLIALYREAVALVQPSLEEGFGLPAAEAMASGTAVITSTAAALVEVTADGALHVDALSESAIAEAMLRVADDDDLRMRIARSGIARAAGFTWQRCASATRRAWLDA